MPTVSVIIPVYNRETFIAEAIQSVLSQTFTDLELIIIDDGSTDNTAQIVQAVDDPRLRYIPQENRGVSAARNHGISLAQGDYIAFLDSDDSYLPTKLERQIALFQADSTLGMVYTEALIVNQLTGATNTLDYTPSGHIYREILFRDSPLRLSTVMVSREAIQQVGGFDESMRIAEDTDFIIRVTKAYPVGVVTDPLTHYTVHDSNTVKYGARPPEEVDRVRDLVITMKDKHLTTDTSLSWIFKRRARAHTYFRFGLLEYLNSHEGVPSGALVCWRRGMRNWPFMYDGLLLTARIAFRLFIPDAIKRLRHRK